ncbi:hypothetical protein RCL1_005886 [Eukaryota sp. TZLM3-RCL]
MFTVTTSLRELVHSQPFVESNLFSFVQNLDAGHYQSARDVLVQISNDLKAKRAAILNQDYPFLIRLLEQISTLLPSLYSAESKLKMCSSQVNEFYLLIIDLISQVESALNQVKQRIPPILCLDSTLFSKIISSNNSVDTTKPLDSVLLVNSINDVLNSNSLIKFKCLVCNLARSNHSVQSRALFLIGELFYQKIKDFSDFDLLLTNLSDFIENNTMFSFVQSRFPSFSEVILKNLFENLISDLIFINDTVNSTVKFDQRIAVYENFKKLQIFVPTNCSNFDFNFSDYISEVFTENSFKSLKENFDTNIGVVFPQEITVVPSTKIFDQLFESNFGVFLANYSHSLLLFINSFIFSERHVTADSLQLLENFAEYSLTFVCERILEPILPNYTTLQTNQILQSINQLLTFVNDLHLIQSFSENFPSNVGAKFSFQINSIKNSLVSRISFVLVSDCIIRLASIKVVAASARIPPKNGSKEELKPSSFIKKLIEDLVKLSSIFQNFDPKFVKISGEFFYECCDLLFKKLSENIENSLQSAKEAENSLRRIKNRDQNLNQNLSFTLERLCTLFTTDLNYFLNNSREIISSKISNQTKSTILIQKLHEIIQLISSYKKIDG